MAGKRASGRRRGSPEDTRGGAVACEAAGYRSVQAALGHWRRHGLLARRASTYMKAAGGTLPGREGRREGGGRRRWRGRMRQMRALACSQRRQT